MALASGRLVVDNGQFFFSGKSTDSREGQPVQFKGTFTQPIPREIVDESASITSSDPGIPVYTIRGYHSFDGYLSESVVITLDNGLVIQASCDYSYTVHIAGKGRGCAAYDCPL